MKKYFKAQVIVCVDDGNYDDMPPLETTADQDEQFRGDVQVALEDAIKLDLDNTIELFPDGYVESISIDWDTLEAIREPDSACNDVRDPKRFHWDQH